MTQINCPAPCPASSAVPPLCSPPCLLMQGGEHRGRTAEENPLPWPKSGLTGCPRQYCPPPPFPLHANVPSLHHHSKLPLAHVTVSRLSDIGPNRSSGCIPQNCHQLIHVHVHVQTTKQTTLPSNTVSVE